MPALMLITKAMLQASQGETQHPGVPPHSRFYPRVKQGESFQASREKEQVNPHPLPPLLTSQVEGLNEEDLCFLLEEWEVALVHGGEKTFRRRAHFRKGRGTTQWGPKP